ncbi:MAG: hypothetical protein ACREJT_16080 [Myxococcota bacterium]
MERVPGKVAIVTGAASDPGLGRGVIRLAGGEALALRQDVTREVDWQAVNSRDRARQSE